MSGLPTTGRCRVLYCFDVAWSIDLQRAGDTLQTSRWMGFQHKSHVPGGEGLMRPLRLSWTAGSVVLDEYSTEEEVEVSFYDFGALCITWTIPFSGRLDDLVGLSALLYGNAQLTARSRDLALEVIRLVEDSLVRSRLAPQVEDYVIFEVEPGPDSGAEVDPETRQTTARILRAEEAVLSEQETADALGNYISYAPGEICHVDWLAAFLRAKSTEDERLVLELATIELLELRLLDSQLDRETQEAYALLARPRRPLSALMHLRGELEHLGRIQADDAMLHEGIDNALKLFGDDYLARVYRTAAARFHFDDWDASIQRKLGVLRDIYQGLAGSAAHRRSELLEWIIIVLIAVEIIMAFTPLG